MHTSRPARVGALLMTSALALGLASVPAEAAPTAAFSTFSISSNVITKRTATQFFGTVATTAPIASARTTVSINGRTKGTVRLILGTHNGGVDIPRAWGAGEVRLGPTTFTYSDGTSSVSKARTYFNARRDIKVTRGDNVALKVSRVGDAVRFRAQKVKVIAPARGVYVSLGRVRLQRLTGAGWRDVLWMKLDKRGNGTLSRKVSTEYRYRLHTDRSATRVEFQSARTPRI